jgi:RNA polymerase sigma factor (sigma-70 family)
MTTYTDQQILKSLKRRESHVVAYIAKKFLPMIEHVLREINLEDEDAEDIFQEALIIIIKKLDSDEFKLTAKFSTYLYAVCKNLIELKKRKKAIESKYIVKKADISYEENFSEEYDRKYQYKIYKHYFSKLGSSCQNILNMHWLDMPMKEIAEKIGSTEGYVRKKKHECKKRLIDLITKNPDNINAD